MLLDDVAEQTDSLLHVGVVKFFELLDEDIQHGDGDFCLLGIVGVDVLVGFSLFLDVLCIVVELVDLLFDHVLHQDEQTGEDVVEVGSELAAVHQAQSLPSCQDVGLLRVSLLELRTLESDHELNELLSCRSEHISPNRAGNNGQRLDSLSLELLVRLRLVPLISEIAEQDVDGILQVLLVAFLGDLDSRRDGAECTLLDQRDAVD